MGITCIAFMVKNSDPVTVDDVIDHVDHVRETWSGIEHVRSVRMPGLRATTSVTSSS